MDTTLEHDIDVILLDEGEATEAGTRYEVAVVRKALGEVVKASQQAESKATKRAVKWAEPRIPYSTLLYFFDTNTIHRACIDIKAQLIGGLGWSLVTEDEDTSQDKVYAALHELLSNPQPERTLGEGRDTLTEILYQFVTDWDSLGNAYLELPRNANGQVAEIYHVRAAKMRRDLKPCGGYHEVRSGTVKASFRGWNAEMPQEANEVVHLREYDPLDDFYGMPTWLPSLAAQLLDRTAVEYNTHLFQNGLMAHFAIIVEGGKLEKSEIAGIKRYVKNNATGIRNAGRGMVLQHASGTVKIRIEKLNMDVKDLMIDKLRGGLRDEVISGHRVPPRLLGVMHAGALGGGGEVEGQLKIFMQSVIRPKQQRLEDFLNHTIVASYGGEDGLAGVKWRIKLSEMDITNRGADASYFEKALDPQKGWMQRSEVRQEQGLPAEEDETSEEED
ncbi:MAG: hypothetical protein RhofKO_25790 [Rhodothermales bacterium]